MKSPPGKGPRPLLKKAEIEALEEIAYRHPLNRKALRHTKSLADQAGLRHLGVHLVRLTPGKESTEFHFHHNEEEFIYILAGKGEAEIGDERHEVAPGDFLAFGAPSLPHSMRNPHGEDLIYLVGGQHTGHDVTEYPRAGKLMVKVGGKSLVVEKRHMNKL